MPKRVWSALSPGMKPGMHAAGWFAPMLDGIFGTGRKGASPVGNVPMESSWW
ncbi:MAG: hypothetical protein WDN24_12230 [Sphingomonas sp.]